MKSPLLFIHGLYSGRDSRKFIALKNYFKDQFFYDIIEWDGNSNIPELISNAAENYGEQKELIIIGDSTGANFAYQLRECMNNTNVNIILVLTSPLLDMQRITAELDFPNGIKPYIQKIKKPENVLIIAAKDDEVLDQKPISSLNTLNNEIIIVEDDHRLQKFASYLPEIERYIYESKINSHSLKNIEVHDRISQINNIIRHKELQIRQVYRTVKAQAIKLLNDKLISDFEIEIQYDVFTTQPHVNKKYNSEEGRALFTSHFVTSQYFEEDELFNMNWSETAHNQHYFCYTLHDLFYHSGLSEEVILSIDSIWYDVKVYYQFCINM